MQGLLFHNSMIDLAVDRLKFHEPPEGYELAFSGGKDSVAAKFVADLAGVRYTARYRQCPDPPELIRFIIDRHPDVKRERKTTMWRAFEFNGYPTRVIRWCCRELKEYGSKGRKVITGVRWAESARRRRRHGLTTHFGGKWLVNPLIDWTDSDVWACIRENEIPYCSLYDEGFKRLGCVLCPMSRNWRVEAERWPTIYKSWQNAFLRLYAAAPTHRKPSVQTLVKKWSSGQALFEAWLDRDNSLHGDLVEPEECELFAGAGVELE
jgi:phosphoadenosine phosphosulfate reductase